TKLERSRLAIGVVKKGIMPMSMEIQGLLVTIVRNRITLPEIAVLQKRCRQRMQTKELDPPPKDVSIVWARK
ncbi:hypothetical protein A2U01_0102298, partial [Trifolium medium]|nr:hypothetical protein [Trifolium medium]